MTTRLSCWVALAGIALAIAPCAAFAKYTKLTDDQLAKGAAIIALGVIRAVDERSFDFEIEHVVSTNFDGVGTRDGEHLRVIRFENWMCAVRWSPYAVGQRALLFIQRFTDEKTQRFWAWRVMGRGNEGEMPVEGDFLYQQRHENDDDESGMTTWKVSGHDLFGQRLVLKSVLAVLEQNKPPPMGLFTIEPPADDVVGVDTRITIDRPRDVLHVSYNWIAPAIRAGRFVYDEMPDLTLSPGETAIVNVRPGSYVLTAQMVATHRKPRSRGGPSTSVHLDIVAEQKISLRVGAARGERGKNANVRKVMSLPVWTTGPAAGSGP